MKKHVGITTVLVVMLLSGLVPVGTAQAAPLNQMRLPGNFIQRYTCLPRRVLNTQPRFGNLSGKLLSFPTLRSIGTFQMTRVPVFDQFARITLPSLTGNLSPFSSSMHGLIRCPSQSLYEMALQTIPGISGGNTNGGQGGRGRKDGDDADDHEEENDKNKGHRGGQVGRGGGSGTPPNPPRLYYDVDAGDDDDDADSCG